MGISCHKNPVINRLQKIVHTVLLALRHKYYLPRFAFVCSVTWALTAVSVNSFQVIYFNSIYEIDRVDCGPSPLHANGRLGPGEYYSRTE